MASQASPTQRISPDEYCAYALSRAPTRDLIDPLEIAASTLLSPREARAQRMLELVNSRVRAAQGSIMLREGDLLRVVATFGHEPHVRGSCTARGHGLAWRVIEAGHELHLFGVFNGGHDRYARCRSSTLVPVPSGGRDTIGTLSLNREAGGFEEDEFLWMQTVAAVLGRLIDVSDRLKDEVHAWWAPTDVLATWMDADPTHQALIVERRRVTQLLARTMGLSSQLRLLDVSAQLFSMGWVLLPIAEPARVLPRNKLLELAAPVSATLLRALGTSNEVCDLIRCAGERWGGRRPTDRGAVHHPVLAQILGAAALLSGQADDTSAAIVEIDTGTRFSPDVIAAVHAVVG